MVETQDCVSNNRVWHSMMGSVVAVLQGKQQCWQITSSERNGFLKRVSFLGTEVEIASFGNKRTMKWREFLFLWTVKEDVFILLFITN